MSKKPAENLCEEGADLVLIGRVVGVHGINGEIKILPYGDREQKKWRAIYLKKNALQKRYRIKGIRPHKGVLLVSLYGCDTRNDADTLIDSEALIERSELPKLPKGEYYHFELEGTMVFTEDNTFIGTIEGILSTRGGSDVYIVKGSSGEILVPAVDNIIVSIDTDKKRMIVRPPEGLFKK
ncbi:MAG: 16S rRNA processing protein RimM [Deltaproteobacteria bacterium]|nr:16S rRNA processing protein RimM [Deltaproteobacteria bacterium]